ncbi:hypothetical protein CSV69_10100 [Sporosarcina sp. P26b]|uniref:SDR family oxidoreductase n=1 Tax=Sporosarcina sp. P26b TaxID=2048253 RepID=UPI000C16D55E|nr:NAD(P)-dependent oxidoreductase [Sporosarcina sp. P26b]PIC95683.1 hypothetical protein CSV69_10100 [Sporosarcina sp. P26b]
MLLVTGITGHTGKYFLQQLIDNNYKGTIRCIIRETSDSSCLDKSGLDIEKVVGDITNELFLNECMKDVSTIVHIVNIRYTLKIVEIAIKNNVSRAIFVHTTGVYSKFKSASEEYKMIESKLEEILTNSTIKVTVLKPTMIYGDLCDHNMSRFIKMIDKFRVFPVIDHGKGLIQPVNARDLGKAYYQVLVLPCENAKSEYILSGEKPIEMKKVLKTISNNLGKKTTFISVPLNVGVFLARFLKVATIGKVKYVEQVQRMSEDRCFTYEEAKKDFGFKPEPFEIGIGREIKQYLDR